MKLRNLMYASMIACAFASCSKDDVVGPDGPNAEGEATLEVKVLDPNTKAMPADADNAKINTITLVVFNNGVVEAIGTEEGYNKLTNSKGSVKTGSIKPGNKEILVLANVGTAGIKLKDSKASVLALTRTIADETAANGFSMNSGVFGVTVAASGTTYVGYNDGDGDAAQKSYQMVGKPIKLYRNVARIVMNSVVKGDVAAQYPSSAIAIKKVFLLHGHNKTTLAGNGEVWGATDWTVAKGASGDVNYLNGNGFTSKYTSYADWVSYMTTGGFNKVYNFIPNASAATYGEFGEYAVSKTSVAEIAEGDVAPFYAYENTEGLGDDKYCTLLVVQADFSYLGKSSTGEDSTFVEADRYYPLAVGHGLGLQISGTYLSEYKGLRGAVDGALPTVNGVLRNLEYMVNLTITGPGYETPFGPKPDGGDPETPGEGGDTFMDAKIYVVPFGTVIQNGSVE